MSVLLESSSFELAVVETLGLPLEFWWQLSYFRRYTYFRFGWPYCYFRLTVVFEITDFKIAMVDSLRFAIEKKQIAGLRKIEAYREGCFDAVQKCLRVSLGL